MNPQVVVVMDPTEAAIAALVAQHPVAVGIAGIVLVALIAWWLVRDRRRRIAEDRELRERRDRFYKRYDREDR